MLVIYGGAMWDVIDDWLSSLPPDTFTTVLPLLRRTFTTFAPPERRQTGERARRGRARSAARASGAAGTGGVAADVDADRAEAVLPPPCTILGLDGAKRWS